MNGSNGKNISVKAAAVICAVCIAAASAVTWGIAAKTGSDPGSPIDKKIFQTAPTAPVKR